MLLTGKQKAQAPRKHRESLRAFYVDNHATEQFVGRNKGYAI